jgi:murein DD-endopeptidase MepM/ murein hydrolase activator NlpD
VSAASIRYGDRGADVQSLQRALLARGYALPRWGADGQLGAETWAALEAAAGGPLDRSTPVPAAVLSALATVSQPGRPGSRVLPIETSRPWPVRGARAWLAQRSDGARLHAGVDLGTSHDRVLAPEPCQVVRVIEASYGGRTPRYSRPRGWGGYGPMAVLVQALESGQAVQRWHLLAHVDRVCVEPGQVLELGDEVARVAPIGAHLHWEVREHETPPPGWATVETVLDPGEWLEGRERRWQHGVDPCPRAPERSARTPRACRPR